MQSRKADTKARRADDVAHMVSRRFGAGACVLGKSPPIGGGFPH